MMQKSSKIFNTPRPFLKGVDNGAIITFLLGSILGLWASALLPLDSLGSESKGFWTFVVVIGIPGAISFYVQSLSEGRYRYENLERNLLENGIKKMGFFDINKHIQIEESKEFLFSSTGLRVEIFRVTCEPENLSECYQVILGKYSSLKDISVLRDTARKEKSHLEADIYIVLSFDIGNQNFRRDYQSITQNLEQNTTRLSLDRAVKLYKSVFNKGLEEFSWEKPQSNFISPVSLIESEALAHFGDIDGKAFGVSLADQPEYIGEHYHRCLDILNKLPSTVHINLKPYVPDGAIGRGIERALIEKHHKLKLSEDKNDTEVHLNLTVSAICHGTKEELRDLSYELERAVINAPEAQKPLFIRETAYLKECLLSTIPGKSRLLPSRRRFRVLSKNEALAYLPKMEHVGVKNPLLSLRTTKNTGFGLSYSADDPLFVWAEMGKGKTSLCSEFVLEHLKKNYRGERQNTFILTAGDGYDYLLDGLCDLALYYDNEGVELKGLDFHPLELFLYFKPKGIEAARNWLCGIMKIEAEALRSEISKILAALSEKNAYKMSDFYRAFEDYTKASWAEADIDHFSRKLLSILYHYCDFKGSMYGVLFEPQNTKPIDFAGLKTVLVTQKKGKDDASDGLIAFYSLATHFADVWELQVTGPLFYLVDELEHLINTKAITIEQVKSGSTQGRKNAKYSVMSSQFLSILTDNNISERFNHFLFASPAAAENVGKIMRLDTSEKKKEEGLLAYEAAIDEISYMRPGVHVWGYLDTKGRIHRIIHDVSEERLWLIGGW
ncbi:MAG: hypothetical protein ACOH5I_26220 [Oligoflexus sp.]